MVLPTEWANLSLLGNGGSLISSNEGLIWSPLVSNTPKNITDIIFDGNKFVFVGDGGLIGISSDKNFWMIYTDPNATSPATFDFDRIRYQDGFYVGIDTGGTLHYSFDLANWTEREIDHSQTLSDVIKTDYGENGRTIAVGSGSTAFYADPIVNETLQKHPFLTELLPVSLLTMVDLDMMLGQVHQLSLKPILQ